jgi:hypothetical protein
MNRLDRFCEAIMAYEGWRPGSRSYRNCNPGNLRWSPLAVGTDEGYAVFATFADGWAALVRDVTIKASGQSKTGLLPSATLAEFFRVYAPTLDANHPEDYARYVIARATLPAACTLADLLVREP